MAGGVHKDNDKYYLFFHASPHTGPYRMGVAVAASPLGPFRMSPANPILTEGKNGTWDDYWVASGNPFRRKAGDWIMLFSARCGGEFGKRECDGGGIGLAGLGHVGEGAVAQVPASDGFSKSLQARNARVSRAPPK